MLVPVPIHKRTGVHTNVQAHGVWEKESTRALVELSAYVACMSNSGLQFTDEKIESSTGYRPYRSIKRYVARTSLHCGRV